MDNVITPAIPVTEPVVAPVAPVTTPLAAAEAPQVAPAPEPIPAPVVAPVVEPAPTPVVAETPVVEAPKPPTTLLSTEPTVAPEPVVVPGETNEGGQSVEPAPPPKYEFQLPEEIKFDETEFGEFTNILAALELEGKADHAVTQQVGQKLVERHINEVRKAVDAVHQFNIESWEKTRTEWKESFLKDPEIGGNRFQTTVDAAQTFIRTHGGTPEQQTEFRQLMETSGLGNHPAMIRILANAQLAMNEGNVVAAVVPPAAPKSKVTTMYGRAS